MKTGSSTPGLANSKEGKVPNSTPAPGLPVKGGKVFGESPEAVSDSGNDEREQENLRQENATAPRG